MQRWRRYLDGRVEVKREFEELSKGERGKDQQTEECAKLDLTCTPAGGGGSHRFKDRNTYLVPSVLGCTLARVPEPLRGRPRIAATRRSMWALRALSLLLPGIWLLSLQHCCLYFERRE